MVPVMTVLAYYLMLRQRSLSAVMDLLNLEKNVIVVLPMIILVTAILVGYLIQK